MSGFGNTRSQKQRKRIKNRQIPAFFSQVAWILETIDSPQSLPKEESVSSRGLLVAKEKIFC